MEPSETDMNLTATGPITNLAANGNVSIENQHNNNTKNIQNYNSYYEARLPAEIRRFSMVPASLEVHPFIGQHGLSKTAKTIAEKHSRVALWGRNGIGKSRFAALLASGLYERKSVDVVFWINGKSLSNFHRDMTDAAAQVGSYRLGTQLNSSAPSALKRWMESESGGTWMFVLDDAGIGSFDGRNSHAESAEESFGHLLPRANLQPRRMVLMTTTNRMVAQQWCFDDAILQVSSLESSSGAGLLVQRSCDTYSSSRDAQVLARSLGGHPAALVAVGAYVRRHKMSGMTIKRYLHDNRRDQQSSSSLLKRLHSSFPSLVPSLNGESPFSPLVLTLDSISTTHPSAIEILGLLCCLNQVRIPFKIFTDALRWPSERTKEVLATLLNYDLVTQDDSIFYSIPHLVQYTARYWFEHKEGLSHSSITPLHTWRIRTLDCLIEEFERRKAKPGTSSVQAHLKQRRLLPHIDEFQYYCTDVTVHVTSLGVDRATGIINFANLYMSEGENRRAETLLLFVLKHAKQDPLLLALAKVDLAESLRSRSNEDKDEVRLKKAIDLLRDARDLITRVLEQHFMQHDGEEPVPQEPVPDYFDHLLYCQIYPCFARIYCDRDRFDRARYFQSLSTSHLSQLKGETHVDTIDASLARGIIEWRAGDFSKALRIQLAVRAKLVDKLEDEETDLESRLLEVQAALVRTYHSLEMTVDAVRLAWEVCAGRLRVLGEGHPKTIQSEKDLAACLEQNQEPEAAGKIMQRVHQKTANNDSYLRALEQVEG